MTLVGGTAAVAAIAMVVLLPGALSEQITPISAPTEVVEPFRRGAPSQPTADDPQPSDPPPPVLGGEVDSGEPTVVVAPPANRQALPAAPLSTLATPTAETTATLVALPEITVFGTATPGSTIVIGGPANVTVTVPDSGSWSTIVTGLVEGDNILTVLQRKAGFADSSSVVLQVTLDTLAPAAPVVTSTWTPDQRDPLTLSGSGEPGATLEVHSSDGSLIGSTTVDDTGAWQIHLATLSPVAGSVAAVLVDPAGNRSPDAIVGPLAFVPSVVAPADGATIASGTVPVTIEGWPGQSVLVKINGASAGIFTLSPGGNLTLNFTSPSGGAVDPGHYTIEVAYHDGSATSPHTSSIGFDVV